MCLTVFSVNAAKDHISHLPSSSSESMNPPTYRDSASSASRLIPNFQRLILNLQDERRDLYL
ncbi:hypothetical protein NQ318_018698 [Aromia moschata]|uniref:Uncharacterized protein n=1 Tax=Aromia moschata TaxID=1265417 RepID=A0AAV8ZI97_9CUCU|nr:hypothetical protein NQ318_018698 [Aromia moschata]